MGKIDRSDSNLFPFPKGAFIRNKRYVYINTSNKYVSPDEKKDKGTRGYTGHVSQCIGVLQKPEDPSVKMFYANACYLGKLSEEESTKKEKPDPPKFADSTEIGLHIWIKSAAESSGLLDDLVKAFGQDDAYQILDLADYMLSNKSAVMQLYPSWARDHVIFSSTIKSDTKLGIFLKKNIAIPKINLFRTDWAARNIGDGRLYLCYDSTNVNCQAEGVYIVQKGHAKDDPTLDQVNTDYVVRQSDGLPFTYLHSPGSISDIAQAPEMIKFLNKVKKLTGSNVELCLICDRGYISINNLKKLDKAGITYILMLKTNFSAFDELAEAVIGDIENYKYELTTKDGDIKYGVTVPYVLYEKGPECYAQIIWSVKRFQDKKKEVADTINRERNKLERFIESSREKSFLPDELKWIPTYFQLQTVPGKPREGKKKRGRGSGTKSVFLDTVKVVGYSYDENAINRLYKKSGIMILLSREKLTAQECLDAYCKRDCVEKVFMALKSHLGMDRIGITTEEGMQGKGLVWFVASILHALLFNKTAPLRIHDRNFTVPNMIAALEAIKADRNFITNKRERRYKLTAGQSKILSFWGIDEEIIDNDIANLVI